jgi:hypothetical protein
LILLISASWVARITGMSHQLHLSYIKSNHTSTVILVITSHYLSLQQTRKQKWKEAQRKDCMPVTMRESVCVCVCVCIQGMLRNWASWGWKWRPVFHGHEAGFNP